jgi:tetratricopeptide (TPR) repeat protein
VAAGASAPYFELDEEAPNIRAALDFYLSHEPEAAVSFIEALAGYWRTRGVINEARSWIGRALPLLREGSRKHSFLLCLAATFATLQDALAESLEFSESALAAYRAAGDQAGTAHAVFRIAEARHRQGRLDEAEPLYRDALEGFTASGESRGQMLCLGNLGMLDFQRREYHHASELLDEAIRRASVLRDRRIAGDFTITLGWVALRLADLARARTLFEEVLLEKGASRDRYGECAARHGIATVALKEAKLSEAFQEFVRTLETARELQLADYIVRALHGLAAVRSLDGNAEAAANLLGLADRLSSESGRDHRDSIAYEVASQVLGARLSGAENSRLRAAGQRLELEDAITDLQRSAR